MQQEDRKTGRFFGDCSGEVIAACIDVHRLLGPGLLESAYGVCLAHELAARGHSTNANDRYPSPTGE
jgi:GxxExxY protein